MNWTSKEHWTVSDDEDEGLFHLLPTGWQRQDEKPFPQGRLETWQYTMTQASGWSREYRDLHCVWANPEASKAERDELREKCGWPASMCTDNRDHTIGKPL